jgi:N,N-dimethylformamidase beta subunit-like, C-terminal/Clostridial hydrophobic W
MQKPTSLTTTTLPPRTSLNCKALRCAFVVLVCLALPSSGGAQPLNRIQKENLRPGTTEWQLTYPARNREIEGYASLTSVPVGGDIDLFVNTKDARYSLTVYRMGWYGGKGGRGVLKKRRLHGVQQVIPTVDPSTGLIECNWTNPFRIHVPSSWLSGIYLVKLHGKNSGEESYVIFTVRDSRAADLVFQQSVTTYQAYNGWPGLAYLGGEAYSLYNSVPPTKDGVQVSRVSFNRPYGNYPVDDPFYTPPLFYSSQFAGYGVGAGDFLSHGAPAAMEFGMLRWLEHEGYDVTYITDVDTHEDVGRLSRGKGYLSVGHDEYWSEQMRANVMQARDTGVSLGFFGGNYMYWAIKLLADASGTPNRTISLVDPKKACTFTCMGAPEQSVVGGNWVESFANGDIVINPRTEPIDAPLYHWVFANTGLNIGDVIPGLIGVEYNGIDSAVPLPPGLQTLVHTQAPVFMEDEVKNGGGGFPIPNNFNFDFNAWYEQMEAFVNAGGTLSTYCDRSAIPPKNIVPPYGYCRNAWPVFRGSRRDWAMTIYQVSSGAWVFNTATNQWSWGLDDYFTGLSTPDSANNGPPFRLQCGYPWFHEGLVSCRNSAVEQITRNVLNRFIAPNIGLAGVVHLEDFGDQPLSGFDWSPRKFSGKRLEGFSVDFQNPGNPAFSGVTIEYMCHLQDRGDTPWMAGGEFCGTRGESRRLEGFAIRLNPGADKYDVFYSCRVEGDPGGDTGPFRNGEFCGTRGQSKRVEAIEVWMTKKPNVELQGVVHLQDIGDKNFTQGTFAGTRGQSRRLEGFSVALSLAASDGGVEYMCNVQGLGDTPWKANGEFCGTRGESRKQQEFAMRLTGPIAEAPFGSDIYYICHVEDFGDLGPFKNGDVCGQEDRRVEGLFIWVAPKN